MSDVVEQALIIDHQGQQLVGVFHPTSASARRGVLIVVGGPQYRVGSHRQFVLLARFLAANGVPVLRFDYRAMGDSEGENVDFQTVDGDIDSAIAAFRRCHPQLEEVVIWGLCDAASAALFYAYQNPLVKGLVLLNPWVRTAQSEAKAKLKHYYLRRLTHPAFWRKLVSGRLNIFASFGSLFSMLRKSRGAAPAKTKKNAERKLPLPERMCRGWQRFHGPVLLILSGNNDIVADEFRDLLGSSKAWQELAARAETQRFDFSEANHTFSSAAWRDEVARQTLDWLRRF